MLYWVQCSSQLLKLMVNYEEAGWSCYHSFQKPAIPPCLVTTVYIPLQFNETGHINPCFDKSDMPHITVKSWPLIERTRTTVV